MSKRPKTRQSLDEILASCSDTLFPDKMGRAPVNIDSKDVEGDTALHVMLWRGDTYGAVSLIDAGAEVDAVGDMSETPLHIAVRKANAKVVAHLLAAGANPDIISEFGQSPRSIASDAGGEIAKLFR
ncbi:ankyrin repeat protein [Yoonia maricola]|uniref:Ankyrin repeat protein n=1 Tax=Yoonia maricola TaxID=420999 RepID=A0A2M8W2R1_9RHOB|nr:ankyrin repeat domain-containing protein [Yoonia maricola]PJI85200.1 ankyrin repeat protein [Yoonia maricola]